MKRHLILGLILLSLIFSVSKTTYSTCGDTWAGVSETSSLNYCATINGTPGTLTKSVHYAHLYWLDGYERPADVTHRTSWKCPSFW
jgi:hypothetical protein